MTMKVNQDQPKETIKDKLAGMDPEAKAVLREALNAEQNASSDDTASPDASTEVDVDDVKTKAPDELASVNREVDAQQGLNKTPGDRRPRKASGPQGVWKKISDVTGETRPYSFARAIRAAIDHKQTGSARVELAVSDHLKSLGYKTREGGLLVPFDSAYLELNEDFGEANRGLYAMMNAGYIPSTGQQQKLAVAKQLGVTRSESVQALIQQKTLLAGDDTLGGFLVQSERSADVIDLLRSRLAAQAAGVREIALPQGGSIEFPTKTRSATAYRKREAQTLTESDLKFGIITLQAKPLTGLVSTTQMLLDRATPDIEAIVREDLVAVLAEREETDIFYGVGTTDEPRGIRNWPNITVVTPTNGAGGNLDPTDTFEMETVVDEAKGIFGAYVMSPRALQYIRQFRAGALQPSDDAAVFTTGGYMFVQTQDIAGGQPSTLNGYPVYTSHIIRTTLGGGSETEIFGGDWSQVWVGRGAVLEITSDTSVGFLSGKVYFKAIMEDDVAMVHESTMAVTDRFATA